MSSVVLFGVVFVYALTGALSGIAMLGLGAALALVGGVLWDAVVRGPDDAEADGAYSSTLSVRPPFRPLVQPAQPRSPAGPLPGRPIR